MIKADLDGDEVTDFESEILSWESLEEILGSVQVAYDFDIQIPPRAGINLIGAD